MNGFDLNQNSHLLSAVAGPLFADVCERKHGGNENSVAVHKENEARGVYGRQYRAIEHAYQHKPKATGKEIAEILDVDYNVISGRFIDMRGEGRRALNPPVLIKTGDSRERSAEYRSVLPRCSCTRSLKYKDVLEGVK